MDTLEWAFWGCAALVGYTYLAYPLLLALATRWRGRPHQPGPAQASVSIILPVHNEEGNLARRLDELIRLVRDSGLAGEILVVSDGSTDRTAETARSYASKGVGLIELVEKQGK